MPLVCGAVGPGVAVIVSSKTEPKVRMALGRQVPGQSSPVHVLFIDAQTRAGCLSKDGIHSPWFGQKGKLRLRTSSARSEVTH